MGDGDRLAAAMSEAALYEACAPELEDLTPQQTRDVIRIVRTVLLAHDREMLRELRLHR